MSVSRLLHAVLLRPLGLSRALVHRTLHNVLKGHFQVFIQCYTGDFPCIQKLHKGEKYAFCSMSRCDINISHASRRDILVHLNMSKLKDRAEVESNEKLLAFFLQR